MTANTKTAYVTDTYSSRVAKYDISAASPGSWDMVALADAGTINPYGAALNWTESLLFTAGQGAANAGNTLGIVGLANFAPLGDLVTNCVGNDQLVVHPDPSRNELWASCPHSYNTVVIDMGDGKTLGSVKVKQTLANPLGGSAHAGSFVGYTVSGSTWTGAVTSDTNGFLGTAVTTKTNVLAGTTAVGP